MKFLLTFTVSVLSSVLILSLLPVHGESAIYSDVLRLHVIAESDSEEDQALKLKVRDALLEKISGYEATSKETALEMIEKNREELCDVAEAVLKNEGMTQYVQIEIGEEHYPTRYYEDFALPAGKYTSVRVIIGEGEGQNWWCVLYPPLCTASAIKYDEDYCIEAGLTKGQYNLITENESGEYRIKFRLLEIASEVFGFQYD